MYRLNPILINYHILLHCTEWAVCTASSLRDALWFFLLPLWPVCTFCPFFYEVLFFSFGAPMSSLSSHCCLSHVLWVYFLILFLSPRLALQRSCRSQCDYTYWSSIVTNFHVMLWNPLLNSPLYSLLSPLLILMSCREMPFKSQPKITNPSSPRTHLYLLYFFHGFCPTFKYLIHFPLFSLLLLQFLPCL